VLCSRSDVAAVSETDDETSEFSTASSPTLSATTSSSSPSSSSTASPPSGKRVIYDFVLLSKFPVEVLF